MSIQKRIRNIWNKSRLNWVILVIPPKSEWNPHLNKDLIYCHFISRSIHHQISNQFQITNCGSTERNISIGRTDQNALRRWVSEKSECFPKYAFPQDNFVARVSVSLFIPYIYIRRINFICIIWMQLEHTARIRALPTTSDIEKLAIPITATIVHENQLVHDALLVKIIASDPN